MNQLTLTHLLIIVFCLISCKSEIRRFDATGTFEANEIIVSAESSGRITSFVVNEGSILEKGTLVGQIDTSELALEKAQVKASINAIRLKQNDATPQISIYNTQLESADARIATLQTQLQVMEKEQDRVKNLFSRHAATEKQLDDINGKVDILHQQIHTARTEKKVLETRISAAREQVYNQNQGITSEIEPLLKRIDIINDRLAKSRVINPVPGTLLLKYVNEGEFVNVGKPLYKIADLTTMTLHAYVDGVQLSGIKLGQEVAIYIDKDRGHYKEYPGRISWISSAAEFTPKTIQTKDERANLVYAVDIEVPNDGFLKIGMYGEVALSSTNSNEKI